MTRDAGRFETATVDGEPEIYDPQTNTIFTGSARKGAPPKAAKEQGTRPFDGDPFREKILALLNSGKAHEDGRTTVDGRDAVRIVSDDGEMALLVDADTYEPIEWRSDGGVTRFPVYEHLPASDANSALLSLTAQHPGATVDDDPVHFEAALGRLSPKGESK